MQRYDVKENIGDGTFGRVFRCINKSNGNVVAIKKLKRKFASWDESMSLRELQCLMAISCSHPNIIKLYEVLREDDSSLYFVFEHMKDGNLYELISKCGLAKRNQQKQNCLIGSSTVSSYLTNDKVQSIAYQILSGLSHLHKCGYIHRDMKPENILLSGGVCKLADFGLAKLTSARGTFTHYVSTRWYRAPEILIKSSKYGPSIDLFAVGCIISETFTLLPLFPGKNEIDQIHKLLQVLGPPPLDLWPEGLELFQKNNIPIPATYHTSSSVTTPSCLQSQHPGLERLIPKAPLEAQKLIQDLLHYNPKMRPTACSALKHEYFLNITSRSSKQTKLTPGGHCKNSKVNARKPNTAQPVSVSPHSEMDKKYTESTSAREAYLIHSAATVQNHNNSSNLGGRTNKHLVQDSPTQSCFTKKDADEVPVIHVPVGSDRSKSQRLFQPKLTSNPYLRKRVHVPSEDRM